MMIDNYLQKRRAFGGFVDTILVATTDTTGNIKTTKTALHKFRIQKLRVVVVTGSAGKTWTFGASTGTPVAFTNALDVGTSGSEFEFDYGPEGVSFSTVDAALKLTISGAGAGGYVEVEGYYGT